MSPKAIIGNLFIISSIFLLIYVYLPFMLLFTPLSKKSAADITSYSIEIPAINAAAPIIADVDPWDKDAYTEPLKKGVAEASDFADFGEKGTIFLFAHSSLPPWEMTYTNTAFLRLNDLELDDEIIIKKFGQVYRYKVADKKEVWPNDTQGIKSEQADQLILQTCIPLGTDIKRLLIYATPVNEQ